MQNVVAVGIIILLIRWWFILRQSRAPSQTLLAGPRCGWERLGEAGREKPAGFPQLSPCAAGSGTRGPESVLRVRHTVLVSCVRAGSP